MQNEIESELDKIEHYQKFPLMKPFIGENYYDSTKKILFIGESHYFDMAEKDITKDYINSSPSKWYESSQEVLHESKHNWINTRRVVSTSTHMVFTELEKVLSNSMEKYKNREINNIAFMNGFQRPANKYGASIKYMVGERDYEEGKKTIEAVVEIIKPDYVIFISKFTWENIGTKVTRIPHIKYEFINHPASIKYWHDENNPHSKYRLIELLNNVN